jgi:hypothetical protein
MNEEWADRVLDENAREGEMCTDQELRFRRSEERITDALHNLRFAAWLTSRKDGFLEWDEEAVEFCRGEGLDRPEAEEVRRRVEWHRARDGD